MLLYINLYVLVLDCLEVKWLPRFQSGSHGRVNTNLENLRIGKILLQAYFRTPRVLMSNLILIMGSL